MPSQHPTPRRTCSAHSRQTGLPCRQFAMRGQNVCKLHGGKSPQALASAEERIRAMVAPALTQLLRIVNSGESDAVRLAAVKDVLDRAGYMPKQRVEIEMRHLAEQIAAEHGLDVAEVIAEAERLVRAGAG